MVLLQRLGWSVVILFGVTLLTFTIAFIVPSDAARTVAGPPPARCRPAKRAGGIFRTLLIVFIKLNNPLALHAKTGHQARLAKNERVDIGFQRSSCHRPGHPCIHYYDTRPHTNR